MVGGPRSVQIYWYSTEGRENWYVLFILGQGERGLMC